MNILLIISPYDPAQTPNTLRWNAVIRELIKKGCYVHVLTTKWYPSPDLVKDDGVTIHRTGHHSLLDLINNLFRRKRRRNISSGSSSSYGFLRRMLEFFVDKLWRNYYWPDGTMLFLKPGQSLARKIIKEYEITHLISVGIPFTNHWIARQLKKDDPAIKWLLDIQDVFSYSDEFRVNNFKRYSQRNLKASG